MAIPGYTENITVDPSETEYYDYIANMVGIIGNSHSEVLAKIKALRDEVVANADFNILDPDGYVDLWKIRAPTVEEMRNAEVSVVFWDASTEPVCSGFVNGRFCIFFGRAAEAYIKEWTLPSPQALAVPSLYISSTTNIEMGNTNQISVPLVTYVFAATFMTRWGETGPSNAVYATTINDPEGIKKWSVVLEVEGDRIPSYATSVRYYRFFDTFRLVSEVKI